MARLTVEDCLRNVKNRFELVLVASKRARQLAKEGATALVPIDGDKVTVIALREIAANLVDKTILESHKTQSNTVIEDLSEISKEIIAETQQTEVEANTQIKQSDDNQELLN